MVGGCRRDVGAAFQERQRAAADEIDLEAEQHVVSARRLDERVGLGADPEQALMKRLTCGAIATIKLPRATGPSVPGDMTC